MKLHAIACLAAVTAACNDANAPVELEPIRRLPTELRFQATAEGDLADGRHIQCSIDTYITITSEVTVTGDVAIRTGSGGGDATRYKELANGNTVGFWAHTGFPTLHIAFIGADSVEIRSPESVQATERFWKEFARFAGNRRNLSGTDGVFAQGDWTCQPMDTPQSSGEYFDDEGSMVGRWTLVRAHNPL